MSNHNSISVSCHRFYTFLELYWSDGHRPSKRYSINWLMLMVVKRTCLNVSLKSSIGVQLCCDLVTVKVIAYDVHNFHTHQTIQYLCLMDWEIHTHQDRNVS